MRRAALICILCLAVFGTVVGAAVAALGKMRWGHADWYYRTSADYRFRCGKEALEQGDLDRVQQIALVLEAEGNKDQAALLRAYADYRQAAPRSDGSNIESAEPLLRRALTELIKIQDKAALLIEAAELNGKCALFLKQPFDAERAFKFVLQANPDSIEAHRGLEALYYDQGAVLPAIAHAMRVGELDPQDGRPYRHMGRIYEEVGQPAEAVRCLHEALRRNLHGQNSASVRKELAECLVRLARYEQALEILKDLDPPPDDAAAVLALRAESLRGLGRKTEALALLDEGLKTYSRSLEILRLRAKIYLEDNDATGAVKLLERAVVVDSYDYETRYQLDKAYRLLEKKVEAAEQNRRAEELKALLEEEAKLTIQASQEPWNAAVRLRLAEICEKLGKPDLVKMWRKAAEACPSAATTPKPRSPPSAIPEPPR
jgi:tetratricopeptide (TPR) repeat protein